MPLWANGGQAWPRARTIAVELTITERVLDRAQTAATRCELPLARWIAEAIEAQLVGATCRHDVGPLRDPLPRPDAGREPEHDEDEDAAR